eukprot:TRINITY_DN20231_c0_g1_i10.p1 TRINITY_DN20231_c0_g1~~TRINITY_DN20231_c0_g1_i10.p1  ORF type:complete len:120 (+),score=10.04 TRINITY_DN20231_c0_g1_i10:173-532(+)
MQRLGYQLFPVNPIYAGDTILGEKCVSSLAELKGTSNIDCVQIFRSKDVAESLAQQTINLWNQLPEKDKAKNPLVFWLQEGVISPQAARVAAQAGLDVVMNRCTYKECQRIMGSMATYV